MKTVGKARAAVLAVLVVLGSGCAGDDGAAPTSSASPVRPTDTSAAPPSTTTAPPTTLAVPTTTSPESAFFTELKAPSSLSAAQRQQLLGAGQGMCQSADGILKVLIDLDPAPTPESQAEWVGGGLKRAMDEAAMENASRYKGGYDEAHAFFARVAAAAGRSLCPHHAGAVAVAFPGA